MAGLRTGAVAAMLVVAACGSGSPRLPHLTETQDYLPGVAADVFLPAGRPAARVPAVVLVPGGAWRSADRAGLRPLAEALAAHGVAAVSATYRIGTDAYRFPIPVADIVCAVDFAATRIRRAGMTPDPVVLLGHSSGAELAALAALAPQHFRRGCPFPPARIEGFIGLAGVYDVNTVREYGGPLFGSRWDDPELWREADPRTWIEADLSLPVLLLHGAADTTLSPAYSTGFAAELRAARHRVELHVVAHADHGAIYRPDVAAGFIMRWLAQLR